MRPHPRVVAPLLCLVRIGQLVVVPHPVQAFLRESLERRRPQFPAHPLGGLLAFERCLELDDVALGLAGEPVESFGTVGCDRHGGIAPNHAIRQERRAGKSVWATTRPTGHEKIVDPESLRDTLDVGDDVSDAASGQPRGFAITRPVDGDPPQPVAAVDRRIRPPADAPARRPVEGDHRKAAGVAPFGHRERAAVTGLDPVFDVLGDDVRVGKHGIGLLSRRRSRGEGNRGQHRDDDELVPSAQPVSPHIAVRVGHPACQAPGSRHARGGDRRSIGPDRG